MATRMVVEDGKYTGGIAFYCYGEGKVEAIRALANQEGYALEHCYAYSDSVTDLPMLEAVGHATVVNPDRALRKRAIARGSRSARLQARVAAGPPACGAVGRRRRHDGRGRHQALAAGALTYSLLRRFAL